MVKRIWIVLLALLLVGCSAKGGESSKPQAQTIGLCVRNRADAPAYYDAIETAFADLGYAVVVEDCGNDQARQDEKVAQLASSCKLLVVEPVMVTALDSVIETAKQAQIPVIFFDREPERTVLDSYEQLYFVGVDLQSAGQKQAALLDCLENRGDLNGDGVVSCVILRGPEDHKDAQLITQSCLDSLAGAQVLECVSAQWTLEDARAQCAQALSRFGPDVEVILCNSPELTQGAVEAVRNGGWTPGQDLYVIGVGDVTEGVAATVSLSQAERVATLVRVAQEALTGALSQKLTFVEYTS